MFFFRELSVGRGSTATFGGGAMPRIQSVDAWDGKDGQVSRDIYLQGWQTPVQIFILNMLRMTSANANLHPQLPEEEEYDLSDVDMDEDFDKDEL